MRRAIMSLMDLKRARTPHYDDPAAVGRRVFEAREAAGLSQRELAFPGCSAAYISRIERGERVPSLQVMRELARRTGVSEQELAFGKETLDVTVARSACVPPRQQRLPATRRSVPARTRRSHGRPQRPRAHSTADDRQTASTIKTMGRDADIVVVGAGITGVATARSLAQSGRGVVLVEQFGLGHDRGSSHGASRIFRLSYSDPHYVRLAQGALQSWCELEAEVGEELIVRTGGARLRPGRGRERTGARRLRCEPRAALRGRGDRRWPIYAEPARRCSTTPTAASPSPTGRIRRSSRARSPQVPSSSTSGV